MKKKIAILGSTGSIGKNLVDILKKRINNFEIILLSTNKNYKLLFKQSKLLNARNLIIIDKKSFLEAKKINKDKNIQIYNSFKNFNKIFKTKIDYSMCAITGIDGLEPILDIIEYTKVIAIANKEALICGWSLIKKKLAKTKTKFIPVDSEHYSIWYALKNIDINNIEKIYITASGGPFLNLPKVKFKDIKISDALKHPNWKMGKKISIDSATMMNKTFEIIEAKNIFDLSYEKLSILVHKDSYIHTIIKFNNGLIKIIAHETTMKIPIFNTLYDNHDSFLKTRNIDIEKLNNLELLNVDSNKFPIKQILKIMPKKPSLFETILVTINDFLVELFLKNKIQFTDIHKLLIKIINLKEFNKYKNLKVQNLREIINLNNYVRLKLEKYLYKLSR